MALLKSQSLSSLSSIEQLVSTLGDQLDLTGEQIADVLWLTLELQKFEISSENEDINSQDANSDGLAKISNQQVEVTPAKESANLQNSNSDELAQTSNQQVDKSQVIELNKRKHSEKKGSVYAKSGSGGSQGLSIGVPDAPSLREPLKLAQALRPLMRQVPTGKRLILDEAATVQRIAEERIFMPVLKSESEHWLDLALVIDESHSMLIWGHTIQELKEIFKKYGIFRDVRIWGLQPDETGNSLQIFSRMGSSKRLTDPKEIVDPTGRRLVLIISDCVSNIWRKGMMFPVLKMWTEKQPLTILQMLPEWMWRRTALDLGTAVGFKSSIMGVANQQLSLHKPLRRSRSIGFRVEDRSKIPVITLDWDKAAQWSQMLIGKADALVPGYLLPPELEIEEDISSSFLEKEDVAVSDLDAAEIVKRFRMTTSPLGRELAGLLAASPVINLPVVRLIQESLLPKSNQVQVAEVFLGGLLRPQSVSLEKLQSQESESNIILNSDSVEYEFIQAEIRDIFLDDAPISDSIDVVNAVSRYVEEQLGVSLTNFMAVLAPQQADIIKPFARITARVLRKLGGQYIQFADEIERKINPETVTDRLSNRDLIDYTTLENLLKIGEWEKADQETNALVLKLASKEEEAHLDTISITQLPCENLKNIDQLWIKYSDGHFGFSIQNKIYRTVGESDKFDKLTWEQFADLVGWHRSGKWLDRVYSLDAPLGHLPFLQIRRTPEDDVNFFSRIANCNLSNDILETSTLANYTQLQELLEQEKWKEADIETATIMFKIAGRVEKGWLRPEDIDNFPIFDLLKIDQLWVRYSNSHFGFSIQKQIYQSLGGTKEYNQKITQELWRRLGLIVNNQPHRSQYNNLIFNLSAPKGHLPIKYDIETPSGVHGVIESLFSRQHLGLPDKLIKDNANKLDELISEKFVSQPYKLYLEKYSKPEDYEIENIQDVILAEAEEIKVRIIDYTLENIEKNTVILSLEIDIEFSIEIRYDDWDSYVPDLHTSDVPFFEHVFSNQRVQGKAEVELSVSEDFTGSEIESLKLDIDEPIDVNDDSPLELTETLDVSGNEQEFSPMLVYLQGDDRGVLLIRQAIQTAGANQTRSLYVEEIVQREAAQFQVIAQNDEYMIARPTDAHPFVEQVQGYTAQSAAKVIKNLEHIDRWRKVVELSREANSSIPADGVKLMIMHPDKDEEILGTDIRLEYKGDKKPRFRVKLKNTTDKPLFCSLFNLEETFAVSSMLPAGAVKLEPYPLAGHEVWVRDGKVIQGTVADHLAEQGITQVTDILKVIACTTDFEARLLEQGELGIPLPTTRGITRGKGGSLNRHFNQVITRSLDFEEDTVYDDWIAKSVIFTIVRPQAFVIVNTRTEANLGTGVSIEPHPSFAGNARLTTIPQSTRDVGGHVLPAILQTNYEVVHPFSFTTTRGSDPGLSALELSNLTTDSIAAVTPETPLKLTVAGASLAAEEELLAIGYDGEFFLPVGLGKNHDRGIEISLERLPEPMSEGKRSLGGSIRIFFQKVISKRLKLDFNYPLLSAVTVHPDESIEPYDSVEVSIKEKVAKAKRIVLFVHGIIGDTESMVPSVHRAKVEVNGAEYPLLDPNVYDLVLAFDYENLNTSIADNARSLKERLAAVGLGKGHDKTLHIVAHSMGGLVSRWFIEREGGNDVVNHLIMLGTPNNGSPWPNVVEFALPLLTVGLNGLAAVAWPVSAIGTLMHLAGLATAGAERKMTIALKEMQPDSTLVQTLFSSQPPGIPYTVIAGNTSLIQPTTPEHQAKIQALFKRIVRETIDLPFMGAVNDIAVKVNSITHLPDRSPVPMVTQVACDHLTYFSHPAGLTALADAVTLALQPNSVKPVTPPTKP